jgi:hypothetical protein
MSSVVCMRRKDIIINTKSILHFGQTQIIENIKLLKKKIILIFCSVGCLYNIYVKSMSIHNF